MLYAEVPWTLQEEEGGQDATGCSLGHKQTWVSIGMQMHVCFPATEAIFR